MPFPVEIVGQHDPVFANERASILGDALGADRGGHRVQDCRRQPEFDERLRTRVQLASAASINGCIRKKRTIGRCRFAQGTIAAAKAAVRRSASLSNRSVDQLGMPAQQHRQRARPDAVAVVLPEQIFVAVRVEKEVAVDDSAAHLRLAGIEAQPGRVDRLARDQRGSVVDPRPDRRRTSGEADGKRVRRLPRGEDEPIFLTNPGHFRGPEIGDVSTLSGPIGSSPLRKYEPPWLPMLKIGGVKDRERVGRIVGRRDQPIIIAVFEYRRVAVTDQDLRVDVFGQQGMPADGRLRMLDAICEDVGEARPEVPAKDRERKPRNPAVSRSARNRPWRVRSTPRRRRGSLRLPRPQRR